MMKKFFTVILSLGLFFCFTGCEEPGVPNPFPGTWINEEYGVKVVFTDSTFTAYYLTEADEWEVQKVFYASEDVDGDGSISVENPAERRSWILMDIKYSVCDSTYNDIKTIQAYVEDDRNNYLWGAVSYYYIDKDGNISCSCWDNQGNGIDGIGSEFGDTDMILTKQ